MNFAFGIELTEAFGESAPPLRARGSLCRRPILQKSAPSKNSEFSVISNE